MKPIISALSMVTMLTLATVGWAQTVQKKGLTLEGAKKVIAAAVAEAKNKNAPGGAIEADPLAFLHDNRCVHGSRGIAGFQKTTSRSSLLRQRGEPKPQQEQRGL